VEEFYNVKKYLGHSRSIWVSLVILAVVNLPQ
jgi:hypothetical protein